MKIAVISHSLALVHPGGAESAAINQVNVLKSFGHEVLHIACVPDLEGDFGYDDESETYLIRSSTRDGSFLWSEKRMAMLWRTRLLTLQPDVVHLHHYLNTGIMLPALIKQIFPNCRVVMTLHEYLAICGRSGQMIDVNGTLCSSSGIQKCAKCLNSTPSAVALNKNLILNSFAFIDYLVCPSTFLQKRYEASGIVRNKIIKIDNFVNNLTTQITSHQKYQATGITNFVFVSQHTPTKGLEVLLRAIRRLAAFHEDALRNMNIEIWGSGSERWPDFHKQVSNLHSQVERWVNMRGRYDKSMLSDIYNKADYMILPSTWWENAPVTIFESLHHGVRVIGSDIGGIREALLKEPSSILVKPNCDLSLSDAILHASRDNNHRQKIYWNSSHVNVRAYETHMKIYETAEI